MAMNQNICVPCPRLVAWACVFDMPTEKMWAWHPACNDIHPRDNRKIR